MRDIEYLELGILEFEKHLEDDPNNEWLKRVITGMKKCYQRLQSVDSKESVKCLNFLKEESIDDIVCFKNSVTTKTLYQLYFTNFDTIEKALIKEQVLEIKEQAFNKGFYDADGNHYFCEYYVPYLKEMHTRGIMNGTSKSFKLKDYKTTWWLKKDKSE